MAKIITLKSKNQKAKTSTENPKPAEQNTQSGTPGEKNMTPVGKTAGKIETVKNEKSMKKSDDKKSDDKKSDDKKVDDKKTELKALRDGFGEGLLLAAKENQNVVALCADLTDSNRMEAFKKEYPQRFVEVGIAEQNLIGVAAGMAHAGKVSFATSFAVFSPGRSWDQVRVSVCYSNANVKIIGGHAGITVGEDGATHQALEDIAITRAIPRMTLIVPADAIEMRKATLAAAKFAGPVYLRSGREKIPLVTNEATLFEIGKANILRNGKDVTIVACGIMVNEAMQAAKLLESEKIDATVIDMHTIKPLDETALLAAAHDTGAIVTAEEHQVIGGLAGAVAETLVKHYPVPMETVGVKDTFCESGKAGELMDKYGLRAKNIVDAAKKSISRKKEHGIPKRESLKVSPATLKKLKR